MPGIIKNSGLTGSKTISQSKAMSEGLDIAGDLLAKINRYALKELQPEDVYARKILLAHNLVDRDRERFSEELLDDFASSLPGKSFLFSHDRGQFLPLGLFFDAKTEEMEPEQFTYLTGETPQSGENQTLVKVLWAWFYVMKTPDSESTIINIEGGAYRHISIGFRAADLAPVKGQYDQVLYWEYAAPGEATEGSLVWLGAQHGATTVKAAKEKYLNNQNRETNMKTLPVLIGKVLGKRFDPDTTEEKLAEAVQHALGEKDAEISDLKTKVTELTPLADEGKAYRASLVDEYARLKACIGECEETPEAADAVKGFAKTMPVDFLKNEIKSLTARVSEKYPDTSVLEGDQRRDKNKGEETNSLIPKDE